MAGLPSKGFFGRLDDAVQAFEKRERLVGKRGARKALRTIMVERFEDAAPAESALSPWINHASMPGIDNAYMLAVALGVRPEWLAFGLGDIGEHAIDRLPPGSSRRRIDERRADERAG